MKLGRVSRLLSHTHTHTHTNEQGHTPLHYAAACSRVDVCALLLDLGGDATQRDSEGLSPLDYARRKKLDYVVALLTCHGTAVADFARASRSEVTQSHDIHVHENLEGLSPLPLLNLGASHMHNVHFKYMYLCT